MKNAELYRNCEVALPKYMQTWEKLVNVDCGSRCGKGINKIANFLADEFKKLNADEVRIIPMANPNEGSHLLVTFKGKGKGKIMAEAHLDTVFPEGTVAQRPFSIDGDWVRGPGCADCKSGVNMMLYAMKQLRQMNYVDYGVITYLFNGDEEIGSPDSRKLLRKLAPNYDFYLCCESGQVGDGIVRSRKGSNRIKLEVHGLASHAGNAPDKGCSALMELIYQISEMKKVEKPELGTTINFTKSGSGTADNVIPDYAWAIADMRITNPEENARVDNELQKLAAHPSVKGTTVHVKIELGNPPFVANQGTEKLITLAQGIYAELGKKLITVAAGGASDANWASAAGLISIDGFGAVKGGKNHTAKECASISSVVPRMYLLSRMLMELGHGIDL